jgi:hypothetical protein
VKKTIEGSVLVPEKVQGFRKHTSPGTFKIFKSMFGTKVFLNGKEVGESELNFTPLYLMSRLF